MTYDERDRRDRPDEAGTPPDEGTEPTGAAEGRQVDERASDAPAEPEPAPYPGAEPEPAPGAGAESEPAPESAEAVASSSVEETATWPAVDSAGSSSEPRASWPTEPPAAGESAPDAWPTEPPAAGESRPDAWPTTPPERGGEPILEPEAEPIGQTELGEVVESPDHDPNALAAAATVGAAPAVEPLDVEDMEPDPSAATEADAELPPPSEVEAYPAAAVATGAAAVASDAQPAHAVPAAESVTGESTQCPRCGTENRPGLAFCHNCGQRLVAAGVAATVERPGTPEGTQACPRCGTHNRAGVGFCQNCGANLRGTASGYVPPSVVGEEGAATAASAARGAVLGPVVLLIGMVGLVTAYLLPFAFGAGSLFERAWGAGGYGVAFWSGYPDNASLAESAYYGLAAPIPVLGALVLALAIAGFMRATPGRLQTVGLVIALAWSVALIVLFIVVEVFGNWDSDLVGLLRVLSPAGIILFLTSLIIMIGTLTRFARS